VGNQFFEKHDGSQIARIGQGVERSKCGNLSKRKKIIDPNHAPLVK
jgi:hypothetical protein